MTFSPFNRLVSWSRALLPALVLSGALWGTQAKADEGRPVGWAMTDTTAQIRLGPVTVHYQPELESQAQALSAAIPGWWSDIESKLGFDGSDALDVYLVSHAGRVAQATGMPDWAAGVAQSSAGKVIVAVYDPNGAPSDLESLTRHELTHVALHRAVAGNWVPRWFNEGVADSLGEEIDFSRAQTMAQVVFDRGVPERDAWNQMFRGAPHQVSDMYAVSRDFAQFLRYHENQRAAQGVAFKQVLTHVRQGVGFVHAIELAYGVPLDELENQWRDGLRGRYFWFPMFSSGDWSLAMVMPLLGYGYIRRRRHVRAGFARLAAQDELEDAQLAREAEVAQLYGGSFASGWTSR
jgi:hypothetical protein